MSVTSHSLRRDCSQTCFPSACKHSPAGSKGAGVHHSERQKSVGWWDWSPSGPGM